MSERVIVAIMVRHHSTSDERPPLITPLVREAALQVCQRQTHLVFMWLQRLCATLVPPHPRPARVRSLAGNLGIGLFPGPRSGLTGFGGIDLPTYLPPPPFSSLQAG